MVAPLITSIGLPILMRIVSEALGQINNPIAKGASEALDQFGEAWHQGQISSEDQAEANRHAERMAELEFQRYETGLTQVNDTMRKELASEDKYVRRMRPTFGYIMAVTWGFQMLAIAYVIVVDTARAGIILNAMSSLSAIWGVGLSVLGVYVYKRSEEKKLQNPSKETIYWHNKDKRNE